MPDVFQFIDDISPDRRPWLSDGLKTVPNPKICGNPRKYLSKIDLLAGRILELGCGTGAVTV
jgi:hypothetical protein